MRFHTRVARHYAIATLALIGVAGIVASAAAALPQGCIENSKDTAVDHQCKADGKVCKATMQKITLNFELEGDAVVIKASGGIAVELEYPKGCDPAAKPNNKKTSCPLEEGLKFIEASGPLTKLKKQNCGTFVLTKCVSGGEFQVDIANFPSNKNKILTALGLVNKTVVAYTIGVTECDATGTTKTYTCPGKMNGEQTYLYKAAGDLCPEVP